MKDLEWNVVHNLTLGGKGGVPTLWKTQIPSLDTHALWMVLVVFYISNNAVLIFYHLSTPIPAPILPGKQVG